jgi:hypothetical protein
VAGHGGKSIRRVTILQLFRSFDTSNYLCQPWQVTDTRAPARSNTTQFAVLLLVEAATYVVASLIHFGVIVRGYEHHTAGTAEAVIAAVLLLGAGAVAARADWTRPAALLAQGFALLGTLVGLTTIAIGIGPRTVPDVAYHLTITVVLAVGLILVAGPRAAIVTNKDQ